MNTSTKKGRRKVRSKSEAATVRQMSLAEAAVEFGVDRITLRRKLNAAGQKIGDGELYTVAVVHKVLTGDLLFERIRETAARADLLELERKEKERDLVKWAEVVDYVREALTPIRQRMNSLPADCSSRCNPGDPQLAHQALTRWVADQLPLLRKEITQ